MNSTDTLTAFDEFLSTRGLRLDAVVVGGTALNLLGIIERPTKDCDILHPALSRDLIEAARDFATLLRAGQQVLADDWLNNGPASLTQHLPSGWQSRLQQAFLGKAIRLQSLGRLDLIRVKVWALCDRGFDLADCLALAPTKAELAAVLPWLEDQDANPDWPIHCRETVADLGKRLGHGV